MWALKNQIRYLIELILAGVAGIVFLVITLIALNSSPRLTLKEQIGETISINNTKIYSRAYFEGVEDTLASIVIGEGGTGNIELTEMRKLLEKRMHQYNIDIGVCTE